MCVFMAGHSIVGVEGDKARRREVWACESDVKAL